jgi:hypothetical protein
MLRHLALGCLWPVLDTLWGGAPVYNLHAIAETPRRNFEERPIGKEGTLFLNAAFLVWAAASAGIGYHRVNSCRDAYNLGYSGPPTPRPRYNTSKPGIAGPDPGPGHPTDLVQDLNRR